MTAALIRPPQSSKSNGNVGALVPVGSTALAQFTTDPSGWLPDPAGHVAPGWWEVTLAAGPLRHVVRCHLGPTWEDATGTWRLLVWRPQGPGGAMLPALDGALGVTHGAGMTTLVLDGVYRPPGGWAGDLVDAAGLRRVAQSTAHRFVTDIAGRMHPAAA